MSFRISKPSNIVNVAINEYKVAPQVLYTQSIPTQGRYWVDGFLSNNIAFFNNQDSTQGTLYQINDVSAIATFNFSTTDVSRTAFSVHIENNRMFTWQGNTWFTCYDISNPFVPTVLQSFRGSFPDGIRMNSPPQKVGNHLYLMGTNRYSVVNISNPIDMSSTVLPVSPVLTGDYAYSRMLDNYFVMINTRTYVHYLWSVNSSGYFPVFTSIPLDPSTNFTGFRNGQFGSSFLGIIRNCGLDKFVMGGSDPSGNNAIRTFEISGNTIVPLSPFIVLPNISFSGPGNCITVDDNLLYVTGNNGFMAIYNINNLTSPTLLSVTPIVSLVRAVQVSGNRAVLGSRSVPTSLQTITVRNNVPQNYFLKDLDIKKYKRFN